MPIRVLKFTKCTKFYKNIEDSSPSVLEFDWNLKEKYTKWTRDLKKIVISTLSEPINRGYKNKFKKILYKYT